MPSWNGRSGTNTYRTTICRTREDYGKYKEAGKGRTQEGQAHGAQESQDRQTAEAARLSAWKQEAKDQEAGSRHFEALRKTPPRLRGTIVAQPGGAGFSLERLG